MIFSNINITEPGQIEKFVNLDSISNVSSSLILKNVKKINSMDVMFSNEFYNNINEPDQSYNIKIYIKYNNEQPILITSYTIDNDTIIYGNINNNRIFRYHIKSINYDIDKTKDYDSVEIEGKYNIIPKGGYSDIVVKLYIV